MLEDFTGVTVRSAPELLGEVPYLLGYHPEDSLVVVLLNAEQIILATGRMDLSTSAVVHIEQWTQAADRYGAASVWLVGYGTHDVAPRVRAVADAIAARVPIAEVLLVGGGEYFCLRCPCPATGGRPFDPATTAAAARNIHAGRIALPSRAALLALTGSDPVDQAATGVALTELPVETDDGPTVLRSLMGMAADGQRLSARDVARLVRLLDDLPVRDAACAATGTSMWQRDLWLDVTRRASAGHIAPAASLAGWCAWRRGEDTLALAAIDRALADDHTYLLARLVRHAIAHGVPGHQLLAGWPGASAVTTGGERP